MQTGPSTNIDFVAITKENESTKISAQKDQQFLQNNFEQNSVTGEKKLLPISESFQNAFSNGKKITSKELEFKQQMESDRNSLQIQYETMRSKSSEEFRGKIEKLLQAVSIDRTEITKENFQKEKERIYELVHNDEGIEENIILQIGDRATWNQEKQQLMIVSAEGKHKFTIRFTELTPEEKKTGGEYIAKKYNEKDIRNNIETQGRNRLGDWIVDRGPINGKDSSCGASVGKILNEFGFKSILPQSGRDGKNWDSFLEKHPLNQYFDKISVDHPSQAPSGSIIVFNENATRATKYNRKTYGHVEIKGSDGQYYFYLKTQNPGGSTPVAFKNRAQYMKETGFAGYVYVYNGKTPPGPLRTYSEGGVGGVGSIRKKPGIKKRGKRVGRRV